jgi:hypothetical protein
MCTTGINTMTLMGYPGAWGKLIHGKNLKAKISWHCPFNSIDLCFMLVFSRTEAENKVVLRHYQVNFAWPCIRYVSVREMLKNVVNFYEGKSAQAFPFKIEVAFL